MILCLATLLNLLVMSLLFKKFSVNIIMSPENNNSFPSSFILVVFISFLCLSMLAGTYSAILSCSGDNRCPRLVPDLRGKRTECLTLEYYVCCGVFVDTHDQIPGLLREFSWMTVELYQFFLQRLRWSYGFLLYSVNVANYIDWILNVKPTLHFWNKRHLVRSIIFFLTSVSRLDWLLFC